MCNYYKNLKKRAELRGIAQTQRDLTDNEPETAEMFPNYFGPVVRLVGGERVLSNARWALPSPAFALEGKKIERGVTNVRNTASPHWRCWLGPPNRCLVPFTSFAEPIKNGNAWFALDETEPLAFFAGIWVPQWKSVRKLKEGETVSDLFAFLTTEPNSDVRPIHPKAMPVVLATEQDHEAWLTADWSEAKSLQRALTDGSLKSISIEALPARGHRGEP